MRVLLFALALVLPCAAQAAPGAHPVGEFHVRVTNRHGGGEVVERFVLTSRAGAAAETTEVSVRTAPGDVNLSGLPAPGAISPAATARVVLDADGEAIGGSAALAQAIRLAQGAKARPKERVALPGGGWFLLETHSAPTVRELREGRSVDVLRLRQRVEGKLASGAPLGGEIRYSICRDLEGQLVGLRGVQRLRVEGQVLETVVELRRDPFTARPKLQDRRVGLAPRFGASSGAALAPALGCLVFVFMGLGVRGLGKRRSLCLLLCVAMLFMSFPCAQQAEAGWPFGLDQKLKDVAETVAPVVTAVGFGVVGGVAGVFVGGPIGAVVGATASATVGYTVWQNYFAKKEIVGKRHEPASRYVSSLGGIGVVEDDEDWVVVLRDGEDTIERYVTQETFDEVEEGQKFRLTSGHRFDDDVIRDATESERQALEAAQQRGEATVTLPGTGRARGATDVLEELAD